MVAEEVRSLAPTSGEGILVYVTSGFDSLIEMLSRFRRETFWVYGTGRPQGSDGNCHFFQPSRVRFLEHLANAKCVVATAGFTLISESLYLAKPYLAFPMEGQYEQELNGFQIAQAGWGRTAKAPSYETIAAFLYDLPEIRSKLQEDGPRSSTEAIRSKLLELVRDDAKLASGFRMARKGGLDPAEDAENR
jgi:uncharacterized protein (TIGR00661 family)